MEYIIGFDLQDAAAWRRFSIYADGFCIVGDAPETGIDVRYGEVEIFEECGDESLPYEVSAVTWAGRRLDAGDALCQSIRGYLNDDCSYEVLEVCDALSEFKREHAATLPESGIASDYFDTCVGAVLPLAYATQRYSFYAYDDYVVMLDDRRGIVSNNHFAIDGLYQVIEDVLRGDDAEVFAAEDIEELKFEIAVELESGL